MCKHKFFPIAENQTIEKKYGLQIIICIDEKWVQSLFQFFYKRIPSDSNFIELDSNKKSSWLELEDGLNGLHNKSLASSLSEIYCSSSLWMRRF